MVILTNAENVGIQEKQMIATRFYLKRLLRALDKVQRNLNAIDGNQVWVISFKTRCAITPECAEGRVDQRVKVREQQSEEGHGQKGA